jgi:hypothetical protein
VCEANLAKAQRDVPYQGAVRRADVLVQAVALHKRHSQREPLTGLGDDHVGPYTKGDAHAVAQGVD